LLNLKSAINISAVNGQGRAIFVCSANGRQPGFNLSDKWATILRPVAALLPITEKDRCLILRLELFRGDLAAITFCPWGLAQNHIDIEFQDHGHPCILAYAHDGASEFKNTSMSFISDRHACVAEAMWDRCCCIGGVVFR